MRGALVVTSTALLVAGCGTDPSTFDSSGQELRDAGTSRVEWKLDQTSREWPLPTTATGSIDYARNRGELVVAVGKASPRIEMRVLFMGRDSYLGVPYRGKLLWQRSSEHQPTGADRLAPGPGGSRPDQVLDLLIKSSDKVETLGDAEIRGVAADHYRAYIDENELDEDAGSYGPRGLVVDAWIDDDGLLRRIRIPFGGPEAPVEVIDLYDFGVPVDVEAPPADEVMSEQEFSKFMARECESSASDESPACVLFGDSIVESSGSEEYSPTETMPRTVTDSK